MANGIREKRATKMPNVNTVASDTMDEEDVKALVLSIQTHGIDHPKTKAIVRRIEQRVDAKKAAELRARAQDKTFGKDKLPPKSQLPASGGTGDAKEKGALPTYKGAEDIKKEFRSKTGEGAPAGKGVSDTDPKVKLPPAASGGRGDAKEKAGAPAYGGRGEGKSGR